jgi:hypothetical protein
MSAGLAKILEKIHTSRNSETPETDFYTAENSGHIDDTYNGLSKRDH